MIPIVLKWQKPRYGAVIQGSVLDTDDLSLDDESEDLTQIRARNGDLVEVNYEIRNLHEPMCVRFANCRKIRDILIFANRYGLPLPEATIDDFKRNIVVFNRLLEACNDGSEAKIAAANMIAANVQIVPTVTFSIEREAPELALTVHWLLDLMHLEIVFAYEVGAEFRRCAECHKGTLIGHLCNARRTMKFCSEECKGKARKKKGIQDVDR